MLKVITIAGSDPSGGAGLQADLKTFSAHKVYGASVVTALTAQNTQGVYGVLGIDPAFVRDQLQYLFADVQFDAIKLGMLYSQEIMEVVAEELKKHARCPIVLDPVMVATSGGRLLKDSAEDYLKAVLLPMATLCTPNLLEARVLTNTNLATTTDMMQAVSKLAKESGTAILLKGGHLTADADATFSVDLLMRPNGDGTTYTLPRLDTPHTHGTGCTLSSAIACRLAEGQTLEKATELAKEYLHRALSAGQYLGIGKGRGPVWHFV
jgi:hydroxymethylpyrimidine/phosphomethylpyrimidine kinase